MDSRINIYDDDNIVGADIAIQAFTKAIRLNPETASFYYNRGNVYCLIWEDDLAIQDLTKAIQLDSKYALAYSARGDIYQYQGKIENAAEDYTLAILYHPDFIKKNQNDKALYLLKEIEKCTNEVSIRILQAAIDKTTKLGTIFWENGFSITPDLEKGALKILLAALKNALLLQDNKDAYLALIGLVDYKKEESKIGLADYKKEESKIGLADYKKEESKNYSDHGTAYQAQDKLEKTVQDYKLAILNDPIFFKKIKHEKTQYLLEKIKLYANDEISILLLRAALDKTTELGAIFWEQRKFTEPSLRKGELKRLFSALREANESLLKKKILDKISTVQNTHDYIAVPTVLTSPTQEQVAAASYSLSTYGEYDKEIQLFMKSQNIDESIDWSIYHWAAARVFWDQGNVCRSTGENKRAIPYYIKAIQLDPKCAKAYFSLGDTYYTLGMPAEAIYNYTEAMKIEPKNSSIHNCLGSAYSMQGDDGKAVKSYAKAMQLNPKSAATYNNMANLYQKYGMYQAAIESLSEAIYLQPVGIMYANRGANYQVQGDYDNADKDYQQARKLNPNIAQKFIIGGNTYKTAGDLVKAIDLYSIAIQLDSTCELAHQQRNAAYYALGNHQKSLEDTQTIQSVNLVPDSLYPVQPSFGQGVTSLSPTYEIETVPDSFIISPHHLYPISANWEELPPSYETLHTTWLPNLTPVYLDIHSNNKITTSVLLPSEPPCYAEALLTSTYKATHVTDQSPSSDYVHTTKDECFSLKFPAIPKHDSLQPVYEQTNRPSYPEVDFPLNKYVKNKNTFFSQKFSQLSPMSNRTEINIRKQSQEKNPSLVPAR